MTKTTWIRAAVPAVATSLFALTLASTASANAAAPATASAEFCSALVQIESTLSSSIPLMFLPPEVAQQVAGYQLSVVAPLFAQAQDTAPAAIADATGIYASAITQYLSQMDFAATTTVEYAMADDAIDTQLLTDCNFQAMPVTASNYEYTNIQETMASGETALTLTNVADQVHEISIARINDDVDLSARDILMLGEVDAMEAITLAAYAAVAPGGTETAFLNLTPGRYYAICFTPTGTMSMHAPGDGAPHFLRGMLKEFVVE
jgi:hypothetical protein